MRESENMERIAVLIPCYNEAQTIEKVVTDWKREIPEAAIYVYDNNSSDDEQTDNGSGMKYLDKEHRQKSLARP